MRSPRYIGALLGYEDPYFWRSGVNPVAMVRERVWQWLRYGRAVSELARPSPPCRSGAPDQAPRELCPAKLRQMARAAAGWRDKRTLLTVYLNRAPFGGPIWKGCRRQSLPISANCRQAPMPKQRCWLLPQAPAVTGRTGIPSRPRRP